MNLVGFILFFILLITADSFCIASECLKPRVAMNNRLPELEKTFIMIKPDGVKNKNIGNVINRFEQKGLSLKAIKMVLPSKKILEEHYSHIKERDFFPRIVEYMTSGPVVAMVWEGKNAVKNCRNILGPTDPLNAQPGTIRGDFSLDVSENVCHGSDSVESAEREIDLWFNSQSF